MRKVEELEAQIEKLSQRELAELRDWFLARDWKDWDAQIEVDAKAGKLDQLISEAKAEYESGKARKL